MEHWSFLAREVQFSAWGKQSFIVSIEIKFNAPSIKINDINILQKDDLVGPQGQPCLFHRRSLIRCC